MKNLFVFLLLFSWPVCNVLSLQTFVDVGFDRSAWEAAISQPITTDTFDNDYAKADVLNLDSGVVSTAA